MRGLGSCRDVRSLRTTSVRWLLAGVLGWVLVLGLDAVLGTTRLASQVVGFFLRLGVEIT